MRLAVILAASLLLAVHLEAQRDRVPPVRTVGTLGPCTDTVGAPGIVKVRDGQSTADCLLGGGTFDAYCMCRDGAWISFGNAGTGTVTNVAIALPADFTVSGSPITAAGTITGAWASQTQAKVFASPASSTGPPSFLALTAAYIPALSSLSGSITDSQVPDTITLSPARAGVGSCPASQVVTATVDAAGPMCAQLAFSDLSGAVTDAQVPNTITVDTATAAGVAASVAAGSIVNASVSDTAAIAESKLALAFTTHSSANDPTSGQKAALAGSSGTPGAGNVYVTDADARNSNARTPTAHAASHQDVGSDELSVAGLSGLLADAQTPLSHVHAAADVTSGTLANARISASSVTQHESALEAVLDIPDLQGTAAVGQIGTGTPASGKYVDGGTGAWTSLPAAGGSPAGSGSEIQYRATAATFGAIVGSSVVSNEMVLPVLVAGLTVSNNSSATQKIRLAGSGGGNNGSLMLAVTGLIEWTGGSSTNGPAVDTSVTRGAAAVVKVNDALQLNPRSSPPVTCGSANTEGTIYYDSSDHDFCKCKGSPLAWVSEGGAGTCS